jgi:hypothetical protein
LSLIGLNDCVPTSFRIRGAAAYIATPLKGKAKVGLLTHDQLQFLVPRFAAIRDALKDIFRRHHRG